MKGVKSLSPLGWLRFACVLAIVGLGLMMWSLFDPRAQPVLVALSLGQAIGTLSLALYLRVVLQHYRAGRARAGQLEHARSDDEKSGSTPARAAHEE